MVMVRSLLRTERNSCLASSRCRYATTSLSPNNYSIPAQLQQWLDHEPGTYNQPYLLSSTKSVESTRLPVYGSSSQLATWQGTGPQAQMSQNLDPVPTVAHHGGFSMPDLDPDQDSPQQNLCQLEESSRAVFPTTLSTLSSNTHAAHDNTLDDIFARHRLEIQLADEKIQRLKKQNNELEETIRQLTEKAHTPNIDPALFVTHIRTDTNNSTDSDLSGITAPDPENPGSLEQLIADVDSDEIDDDSTQDTYNVEFLLCPREDGIVPRAIQGMPSVDSGCGTNKTDSNTPQHVRPSDTMKSRFPRGWPIYRPNDCQWRVGRTSSEKTSYPQYFLRW